MTSTSGRLNDPVVGTPHRVYGATVAGAGLGAPAHGLWPAWAAAVAALLPFSRSNVTGLPLAAKPPLDHIIGGTGHVPHGPVLAYARTARVVALVVWIGGPAGLLL